MPFKKYTDTKAIEVTVMSKSGKTVKEICNKFKIATDTVYKWIKIVNSNPDLFKKVAETLKENAREEAKENTLPVGKSYHSIKSFVENYTKEECQKLQDDNAFLRWWNAGERAGWVDRLLQELGKKK